MNWWIIIIAYFVLSMPIAIVIGKMLKRKNIQNVLYSVPNVPVYEASEIIKKFVRENDDETVLSTIRELSRQSLRGEGDYYRAAIASMIKQAAGLQIAPPEAMVRKIEATL